MVQKFWFEEPGVLINMQYLSSFFPTTEMTLIEKLNAIMRLTLYLGVILMLIRKNYLYLYIPIVAAGFTLGAYYYDEEIIKKQTDIEKSVAEGFGLNANLEVQPTSNNPLMNINLITSERTLPPAPMYYDDLEIKSEINDKFNTNLYRNVDDLYGKANSQRQYYTMPSTTIPNRQTEFAKWCYQTGPTCKESSIECASNYPINGLTQFKSLGSELITK